MNKYFIFTALPSSYITCVVGSQRGHFLPRIFMHSDKKFISTMKQIPATCKFLLNFNYERSITYIHSSEIRGLCLTKWPGKMLQSLSTCTKARAFIRWQNKVARNEKRKKITWVFIFQKYGKILKRFARSFHQA